MEQQGLINEAFIVHYADGMDMDKRTVKWKGIIRLRLHTEEFPDGQNCVLLNHMQSTGFHQAKSQELNLIELTIAFPKKL